MISVYANLIIWEEKSASQDCFKTLCSAFLREGLLIGVSSFVAGRSDSVWSRREEETKIEGIWWKYGVVAAVFLQDSDLIIVAIVVGFFCFRLHLDWLNLVCGKSGKSVCFTVQRILLSLDFCNKKNLVQFRKIASNWSSKPFLSIEESCDINVSVCCHVVPAVFL